jgi:TonB-linked SusC/RagA family outer membrane protein
MRRFLTLLLGILLTSSQLYAQSRAIAGKIVDNAGAPLVGATVSVVGGGANATTNATGAFVITVPASARQLEVTYVGFATQRITLGSQTTVSITMAPANSSLEEVVVTGYGREKKGTFAGAASVISAKAIETVPVGAFDQALQGRAPGVLVNSGSGQPGSSATVTIRGVQSIQGAGAQPLYILDGIPLPAFDMQTINPNDFESITVLKDANAAALYGARGGTGVIVITSKKGKQGTTNFTFRSQVGLTQAPSFDRLNMMNTSEILEYEERMGLQGAGTNTPGWTYSKKNPAYAALPAATQARYDFLLDSIRGIDINYADVFYRQGLSQTQELNMSGGSGGTTYFVSGGYFDQEGIDLGSSLTRYTTRFNIGHTANKLTVNLNSTIGYSITQLSEGEFLGNSARNPFQMTYRAKPYENPYRADGSLIFGPNTTLNLRQVGNLLEGIENSSWTQRQFKINGGLNVAYRLFPTFTVRHTLGADVASDYVNRYITPASYIGSLQTFQSGYAAESYRNATQIINTTSGVFSKSFGRHDVETGAYFETVRGYQRGLGFQLFNLDARLSETGQGAGDLPISAGQTTYPQRASSAKSGFGIRSYFATAKYTYDGKYTINGNIRRDGTSRIANDENNEVTTWSAGVIWSVLRENFMQKQNIFTDLRVRASYGIIPNIGSITTGGYGISGGLVGVTNYLSPQIPAFATTNYAGSTLPGLVPSTPGNPNLKIERIQKLNIGTDLAMWKNRARVEFDVYKNKTIDLFVNQPLSGTTGFGNLAINAGTMTNKGFEVKVDVDVVKQRDYGITLGVNHSMNKNTIEDLGLVNEYFLGTFVIREGLPYGTHFTYNYLGADPATGRPRYEKEDGTETTNIAQAGRFAKFGTYLPKHQGGFNGSFKYKAFSIDAFFTYQFDVVRSNNTRNWITRGTPGYHASVNASRELLTNQWQKPGDVALFQAVIYDRDFTSSDLEDAKFLRFRNLNVAYQLPEIKIGGTRLLKSGRFYVQAQNLAIWSPWRGLDPEDNNNISLNEYPNPKMFVTGIDINF